MLKEVALETTMESEDAGRHLRRDEILEGDCVSVLNELQAESVDMIFANPPCNLQLNRTLSGNGTKVESCDADSDKISSFKDYDDFTRNWMSACQRVLKPNGTIWVIGSFHNIFRVGTILQDLDYWILNDVIWVKGNPISNFLEQRFTNTHETLIWASRGKNSKCTFNYYALKTFNDDKQMRSDWTFPLCAEQENVELDSSSRTHPSQKPESLLYRILLASTNAGDLVLDPFFGTGITGAVAKKMGRHFLGIERESEYIAEARQRIAGIEFGSGEQLEIQQKKPAEDRIPFDQLIKAGLIKPGMWLTDAKSEQKATVKSDGSLKFGEHTGSIHRIGSIAKGTDQCNGWKYWHLIQNNKLVVIDELRTEFREKSKKANENANQSGLNP